MSKKIPYEVIKQYFESQGYVLLSTEYIGARKPLSSVCASGHYYEASWSNFKRGKRCAICKRNRRFTFEEVQKLFTDNGYILLDQEYRNTHTRLTSICPEGHIHRPIFNNFKRGQRCGLCSGTQRLTLREVKLYFERVGYSVTSTYYQNASTKLDCICPEGHQVQISWNNFRNGVRCSTCFGGVRHDYEYVKAFFEQQGCVLLSTHYENTDSKLLYICSCGKQSETYFNNFRRGIRCGCNYKSGPEHPKWKHEKTMEERVHKRNYIAYRRWRSAVYERDQYTCQRCFLRGGKLHGHHILNYATNKDLRTDVSNGITLCEQCHIHFHVIYGKTNNTYEQIIEFIKRPEAA